MQNDERAEGLLELWFGSAASDDPDAVAERNKLWFQATPAFDERLRSRFSDLPSRLRAGEFDAWRSQPRTALARIVALDQIPRNVYRGTPGAFAFDATAQAAAIEAVAQGIDRSLNPIEAVFVYLPFEHAEDKQLQARSVALFDALRGRAPVGLEALFDNYFDYALRHAKVIEQFGRFPHRNDILGRAPMQVEVDYLEAGGQRF